MHGVKQSEMHNGPLAMAFPAVIYEFELSKSFPNSIKGQLHES